MPFAFVLDELEGLSVRTKAMFGAVGVYVGDLFVFILRDHAKYPHDNGVWIATTPEHHASLKKEFPAMRSIRLLAKGAPTKWQNLPKTSEDFESSVVRACALVRRKDARIGTIPKARKKKVAKKKSA